MLYKNCCIKYKMTDCIKHKSSILFIYFCHVTPSYVHPIYLYLYYNIFCSPEISLQNKLRASISSVAVPCYTTMTEGGVSHTSFKISLQSPHSSTTVFRRYGNILELHSEIAKQFPHLDMPLIPPVVTIHNTGKLEEQRVLLETYLNEISRLTECWSLSAFGSFFCVQLDATTTELTSDIISRVLMLGHENVVLTEQLKLTSKALLDATSQIQQLDNRINMLEGSWSGNGSKAVGSRGSGSWGIGGERTPNALTPTMQNSVGVIKPKHRLVVAS
jgi:hypothetical protein